MHEDLQLFQHKFVDNKAARTLFLLHGTGGNTDDFLFLDGLLDHQYNLVSLLGNVDENGMKRFFKRHSFGVFDQENIRAEAHKLQCFIQAWQQEYEMSIDKMTFLGYSNGANMLLATVFLYPEVMRKLVLLHPMVPIDIQKERFHIPDHRILVSAGMYDHMISETDRQAVVEILRSSNADLTVKEYASGHEITDEEIADVVAFLK